MARHHHPFAILLKRFANSHRKTKRTKLRVESLEDKDLPSSAIDLPPDIVIPNKIIETFKDSPFEIDRAKEIVRSKNHPDEIYTFDDIISRGRSFWNGYIVDGSGNDFRVYDDTGASSTMTEFAALPNAPTWVREALEVKVGDASWFGFSIPKDNWVLLHGMIDLGSPFKPGSGTGGTWWVPDRIGPFDFRVFSKVHDWLFGPQSVIDPKGLIDYVGVELKAFITSVQANPAIVPLQTFYSGATFTAATLTGLKNDFIDLVNGRLPSAAVPSRDQVVGTPDKEIIPVDYSPNRRLVIHSFGAEDRIDLRDYILHNPDGSLGNVRSPMQYGSDVVIQLGPNQKIVLANRTLADIRPDQIRTDTSGVSVSVQYGTNAQGERVPVRRKETYTTEDGESIITLVWDEVNVNGVPIGKPELQFRFRDQLIDGQRLGATFGSQLGSILGGDDPLAKIAAGTLSATILGNALELITNLGHSWLKPGGMILPSGFATPLDFFVEKAFNDLAGNALKNLQIQSTSTLASLLIAEAAEKLKLNGFAGQVFTTTGNTISSQLLNNVVQAIKEGRAINENVLLQGLKGQELILSVGKALGSMLGSKLAGQVVDIDSVAEGLFSSVAGIYLGGTGASIGAAVLSSQATSGAIASAIASTGISSVLGSTLGGILLPGVGALLGTFIGETVGSAVFEFLDRLAGGFFSGLFEKSVWHYRYVQFDPATNRLIAPPNLDFSKNTTRPLRDGTYSLTEAYRETVNNIIASVGGTVDTTYLTDPSQNALFAYVGSKAPNNGRNQYRVVFGNGQDYIDANGDPARIVRIAIEYELSKINFVSGDPVKRRAFDAWKASLGNFNPRSGDSLSTLMSNLQLADDYNRYLENTGAINALIAASPDSSFAVGWLATLLQAKSIGLNARYSIPVTNSNDDGPGSLRNAIVTANRLGGGDVLFQLSGQDPSFKDVDSAIAGGDAAPDSWYIRPQSPLPALKGGVRIAGLSQMGGPLGNSNPFGPEIILDGSYAGASVNGLVLQGDANVVEGVVIRGFSGHGILVDGGADHRIAGNHIGTGAIGQAAQPNGRNGILFQNGAHWSLVESNIIAANGGAGIALTGQATDGNFVRANQIGTAANGLISLGNNGPGVQIDGGAKWNVIGGATVGDRNLIAGNQHGVYVSGNGTDGNRIEGNWIGLNANGNSVLGNTGSGIVVRDGARHTVIGGKGTGVGNVISGNRGVGVELDGADVVSTMVAGNLIGLDPTGIVSMGNGLYGVDIRGAAHWNVVQNNAISGNLYAGLRIVGQGSDGNIIKDNLIGTSFNGLIARGNGGPGIQIEAGARWNALENNLLSGNQHGVYIAGIGTDGNRLERNRIGLNISGQATMGNLMSGVVIRDGARSTLVGSKGDSGNVISGNGGVGVEIDGVETIWNQVIGNLIGLDIAGNMALGNGQFGIDIRNGAHWNLIEANAVSANLFAGLRITGKESNGNSVRSNYFGISSDGTKSLGNGGPGVQIDGGAQWNVIGGTSSTERNVISGSMSHGVYIAGVGTQGNRIEGNYIGLNATGTATLANSGDGVHVRLGASSNIIGGNEPGQGNLIAGNIESGVVLDGIDIVSTLIVGNVVGLVVSGLSSASNQFGISIRNGAHWNVVENNTVSSNRFGGILLTGNGTDGNIIRQNRLGTTPDGRSAAGNAGPGLFFDAGAKWNLAEDNTISGGLSHGVYIAGNGTNSNRIERNRIGVSVSEEPLPNAGSGILIQSGAKNNTIGARNAGNIIAYNSGDGIELYGTAEASSPVLGNTINANLRAAARLGIDAPPELFIYFSEMTDAIRNNNKVSGEVQFVSLPLVGDPPPKNAKDDPRPVVRSLVPAYFKVPDGKADWLRLIEQNRPGEAEVILVVNVGVGAGGAAGGPKIPDGWDSATVKQFYREALVAAYRRGIKLLGYVSTDYGRRSFEQVKQDIADWKTMWPGLTGIFLDEQIAASTAAPNTARALLKHYQAIRSEVIYHFGPTNTPESDPRVVTNPGTFGAVPQDLRAYLDSVADIMLIHEETRLNGVVWPSWMTDYSPNRFALLLHQQATLPTTETVNSLWINNVFITHDGADGNPWDTAPTYWENEVALLTQVNTRPLAMRDDFAIAKNMLLSISRLELLANDRVLIGSTPKVAIVDNVMNGILRLNTDGSFVYIPNPNFVGTDQFTYRFIDTELQSSNVATVNITVGDVRLAISMPSRTIAGRPVTISVRAVDQAGRVASKYSSLMRVSSNDPSAKLPSHVKLTNGVGTFDVIFTKSGNQTIRVEAVAPSVMKSVDAKVSVIAGAALRYSLSLPTSTAAGKVLSAIVTAYDAYGNQATGYTGVVRITSSDASASRPANARLRNGTGTFRLILKKAGDQTITASDTVNSSLSLTSKTIKVFPNITSRLRVVASPSTVTGEVFKISVTALDAYDNISTGYMGIVRFTSNDDTAILPDDSSLTNGVGIFNITLKQSGFRRITITDVLKSSLTAYTTLSVQNTLRSEKAFASR